MQVARHCTHTEIKKIRIILSIAAHSTLTGNSTGRIERQRPMYLTKEDVIYDPIEGRTVSGHSFW